MDFDTRVKLAVYQHFAATGRRPAIEYVAAVTESGVEQVTAAYANLRAQRVLVLDQDGVSVRMAPPFSGVPTQHVVWVEGTQYYANCAWDALGIPAALHRSATVHSRCEQSGEPLHLKVTHDGPEPCDWVFHCLVPASKWWEDVVFT